MMNSAVLGAFLLLIVIAWIRFISALNFPFNYKVLLYLPAILFFVMFLFLGTRSRRSGESEPEIGGFPY